MRGGMCMYQFAKPGIECMSSGVIATDPSPGTAWAGGATAAKPPLIPRARVAMAIAVKAGVLPNDRSAYLKSEITVSRASVGKTSRSGGFQTAVEKMGG